MIKTGSTTSTGSKAIYWFRNNLRLRDNRSLRRALDEHDAVLPVVFLPADWYGRHGLGFARYGPFRKKFYLETIRALQSAIRMLGGELHIRHGDPLELLPEIAAAFGTTRVYTCSETAWYERLQETALSEKLELITAWDQLMFDVNVLPFSLDKLPFIFGDFRRQVEKKWRVRSEVESPDGMPFHRIYPGGDPLPSPDIRIDGRSAHPFTGGEAAAWERLRYYGRDSGKLSWYKKTRNGLIGKDYSTKLSGYLALGAISPVSVYHEIKAYEAVQGANQSTYWVIFELLWREYFKLTGLKYGNRLFFQRGIRGSRSDWKHDPGAFDRWRQGRTADDFVNANMKELAATGFMSNRGRQNAASYLAHDLGIDWRWGAAWFESQLVDYDCESNWCNWMYVAGVGNNPRIRKFDTVDQARRYDPKGTYRRRWNSLF